MRSDQKTCPQCEGESAKRSCPTCGARPGRPCVNMRTGRLMDGRHRARPKRLPRGCMVCDDTGAVPRYPEHEKMRKVKDQSQVIGEFLDYGPYTLCTVRHRGDNGEPEYVWCEGCERDFEPDRGAFIRGRAEYNPAYESWGDGFVPVGKPIQTILAEYFDIDLDKIEAEKREMLDNLREANAA